MMIRSLFAGMAAAAVLVAAAPAASAAPLDKFNECAYANGVTVKLPGTPPPPPKGSKPPKPGVAPPAPQGVSADVWANVWAKCSQLAPKPAPPK